ncbi:histidine-rich glycoprotein-like [Drosophila subobscura]|uniref:histidine-rich glycoprotein-like n=1 Tax=Drosophila subobscura TaxID=7241 RepID=UPI00155B3140|nr:histidine-rich glycoprotein-like [Drosophila subobscura]
MLSRLLLIFGLLMLSWQWGQTMPRHEETSHKAVHEHTTARHSHGQHTTARSIHGHHTTPRNIHGHHTTPRNIHGHHTTARQLQDVHTTRKTILGRLTQKTGHGHTTTTPSSVQATPTAIEEPIPGNFSGISTVSLFDVPPSCKPGHVPTGPNQRCRLEV